ncbi:MAG: PAS domain S-box protein [Flavipsychrobacter sp.]
MAESFTVIIEDDLSNYGNLLATLISIGYKEGAILHFSSIESFIGSGIQDIDLVFADSSLIQPYSSSGLFFGTHFQRIPLVIIGHSKIAYRLIPQVKEIADAFILIDWLDETILQNIITIAKCESKKRLSFAHSNIDYKRFFEESPCPMWVLDTKSLKFLDANPAVAKLYGYTRAEFLALNLSDLRNIDDNFKATFANRPTDTFYDAGITQHKRKSGEPIFVHIYSQNLVNNDTARLVFVMDANGQMFAEQENAELNRKIKKQKELLEEILSSINDVVWSRDRDFKLTYINAACTKVFGYSPDELIGKGIEFTCPDDIGKVKKAIEQTIVNGTGRFEYRVIHKNGSIRNITNNIVTKKDIEGGVKYFTGVSVDLTEIRAMEQELKKHTKEIENILESIRDGFFSLDRDWNFVYVNKAFELIFQCNRKDVIGINYWDKFENAKHQKFYIEYHRAYSEQVDIHFEEYATSLNKWVYVSVYPSPEGITVYFTDITEEKQLKEKTIRDEYNLRSLINNTEDLIWSINTDMRLISANDPYVRSIYAITGTQIQPGDLVLMDGAFDDSARKKWQEHYRRVLSGESFQLTDGYDNGGIVQYMEISFAPMYDNQNCVVGGSCFARNVTDQRNHLLKIEKQNEQLKKIAWIQCHEVRAPLATIMGLIPLMNYSSPTDADNINILNGIKSAADQLDNMIKSIVDITIDNS